MTLKEEGDHRGEQPDYQVQAVSLDPPFFLCHLRFVGNRFSAQASTKKRARQLAAIEACATLRLG